MIIIKTITMKKIWNKIPLVPARKIMATMAMFLFMLSCTDNGDKSKTKKEDETTIADTASRKLPETEAEKMVMPKAETAVLTIANISKSADGKKLQVRFNERAQIFNFDIKDTATNTLLKSAFKKK